MFKDLSITSVTAGFVAVLVGFTGSAVIVFQAAEAAGASPDQISSWLGALGLGMAATSIGLSLFYRTPVLTAWSTPGAALLATSLSGIPMSEAIGAFMFSAALIILFGFTGWFERIMDRIPLAIASAMLAGVLLRFGLDIFVAMSTEFVLALTMFLSYLVCKRITPRYTIVIVLLIGIALAWQSEMLNFKQVDLAMTTPVFTAPSFSWSSLIGIGIPLFIVTMASQNIPGIVVMRASGYHPPLSPIISWTGITTFVLAPFGGYALNLAAITAAICMGKEAHEDPDKRYTAAVAAGVFYLLIGILATTMTALLVAFPKELVLTIAGLALLSTITNSLYTALGDESQREPAVITFLVTVSGVSLFGIGAAFWGLIAGVLAWFVFSWRKPK